METIALYNNENMVHNNVQTMTSLEIAELTGKQHKNVMQAIRNMELAWEKVCGLKFQLTSRTIVQPNGGTREVPCYMLTKTECLYIATKFNDEARAKLVLRWQQLELAEQERRQQLCLPSPRKILALADEIIGEGLRMLNEPGLQRRVARHGHPVPPRWTLEHLRRSGRPGLRASENPCELFAEGREEDTHVHDVDAQRTAILEFQTWLSQFLRL